MSNIPSYIQSKAFHAHPCIRVDRSSPCMGADGNFNHAYIHPAFCPDTPAPSYPDEELWTFVRGAAIAISSDFVQGPSTQITFYNGQMCLDLIDIVKTPGQSVQLWECAEEGTNPNQQWSFNSDATITLASDTTIALQLPQLIIRPTNLASSFLFEGSKRSLT